MDTRVFRGGPRQRSSFGDSNFMPQTGEEVQPEEGKRFDTALLGKMEMRLEYVQVLRKTFNDRTEEGSVEERLNEAAEQHLRRRRVARKKWISDDTLELVELKCMTF